MKNKLILVDKEMEVYKCQNCGEHLQFDVQLDELRKEQRVCPTCNVEFEKESLEQKDCSSSNVRCKNCKKVLTINDELEYSETYNRLYCSPDCATNDYFNIARSISIEDEEKKLTLKNGVYKRQ